MNKLTHCFIFTIINIICVCHSPADVNVLIIGSATSGNELYSPLSARVPAFHFNDLADHLRLIMEGAGFDEVYVETKERFGSARTKAGMYAASTNLASWFYWPFPAGVETTTRWPDLRGEKDTEWDYVVLIGDPYTIENTPGIYTFGVSKISEEVAKGNGETLLLMPWPSEGSASTLDHYREVVYRTGRSGGIPVAPAGLAWQAAGAPVGTTHPSSEAAYIAAATLFSRMFDQNAKDSTYTINDAHADSAYTTVVTQKGEPQYDGEFNDVSPFSMLGDKRTFIRYGHKGSSTENNIKSALGKVLDDMKIDYDYGPYGRTYSSNTPDDDGRGWPVDEEMPIALNLGRHPAFVGDGYKSYETNPNFWQLGFGYVYQWRLDGLSFEDAKDHFVGGITTRDLSMAHLMLSNSSSFERDTARAIPLRALWAAIVTEYPNESHKRDITHLSRAILKAAASYMYTMYSGRTPVMLVSTDSSITTPGLDLFAQRIGYEMAWQVGRLQTRAPGFKVEPTEKRERLANGGEMDVYFLYPPEENVVVTIALDDSEAGTVSPETLTFTPQNYLEPQTVSITPTKDATGPGQKFHAQFTTASEDIVFDGLFDSWDYDLRSPLPPVLTITQPSDGASFPEGATVVVRADAFDPDGSLERVRIWINDQAYKKSIGPPYVWGAGDFRDDLLFQDLEAGQYKVKVRIGDNQGTNVSETIFFTVEAPDTTPPAVPSWIHVYPGDSIVKLDWADNMETDFSSYTLYRSTTSMSYGQPLVSGLTESLFVDEDAENNRSYYYAVAASDETMNESNLSTEVRATPHESLHIPGFRTLPATQNATIESGAVNLDESEELVLQSSDGDKSHVYLRFSINALQDTIAGVHVDDLSSISLRVSVLQSDSFQNEIALMALNDVADADDIDLDNDPTTDTYLSETTWNGTELTGANAPAGNRDIPNDLTSGPLASTSLDQQISGAQPAPWSIELDLAPFKDVITASTNDEFTLLISGPENGTMRWASVDNTGGYLIPTLHITTKSGPDEDEDHVADEWEIAHFGSTTASDGSDDPDEDGTANFFEYLYGSNPNDASSLGFSLSSTSGQGGEEASFKWATQKGMMVNEEYEIWMTPSLLSDWSLLPQNHYILRTTIVNDRINHELKITHDYGKNFFLRIQKP